MNELFSAVTVISRLAFLADDSSIALSIVGNFAIRKFINFSAICSANVPIIFATLSQSRCAASVKIVVMVDDRSPIPITNVITL